MRARMVGVASVVAVVVAACTPTVLQSVSSSGTQGNGASLAATVSDAGHLIDFAGPSTNLVAGDTNGHWDVFVHDANAKTTTRVSVGKNGVQANADSGGSARPSLITPDGRFVAFDSAATNLDPNATLAAFSSNVFVHDRATATTELASWNVDGKPFPGQEFSHLESMSNDGRYVLFEFGSQYLRDRSAGSTTLIADATDPYGGVCGTGNVPNSVPHGVMSGDATKFVFEQRCDTSTEIVDHLIYVNRTAGTFTDFHQVHMVKTTHESDTIGRIALSNDGGSVVWTDYTPKTATTPTLWCWQPGHSATSLATGSAIGGDPAVSRTGRYVAWDGAASLLVLDRTTNATVDAARAADGSAANNGSFDPGFSNDESTLVFSSYASNLVPNDTNNATDVFTRPLSSLFASNSTASRAGIRLVAR